MIYIISFRPDWLLLSWYLVIFHVYQGRSCRQTQHGDLTSSTNNQQFNKTQPTSLPLHLSQAQHMISKDFSILYWLWVSQQLGLKVWIVLAADPLAQTTRYPTTCRRDNPHSKLILCSIGHSCINTRLWYVPTPMWRLFNSLYES
jgi:hypothetical protein